MAFQRKEFDVTIGVAFLMFIVLGLPDGLLGLAWPSIREEFGLPLDAIGAFLVAFTVGFMLTSFNSGALVERLGVAQLMLLATVLRGAAMIGVLVAPSWAVIVALGGFMGAGTGMIDAALNTYVATYQNNRLMNWLHAAFGVGATIGPLLMTVLFSMDLDWRWGYVLVGVIQLGMLAPFLWTRARWRIMGHDGDVANDAKTAPMLQTLRMPLALLGIATFAFYSGMEFGTGQWAFTLFTEELRYPIQLGAVDVEWFSEGRGISPNVAGLFVAIFYGSFTIGRIVFGIVDLPETLVLRVTLAAATLGTALLLIREVAALNLLGLIIMGFALAPMFPMLINSTAARMSPRHAPNAIGFQVGAASLGGAVFPWLIGYFAERNTVEAIAPTLLFIAFGLVVCYELINVVSARRVVAVQSVVEV